MNSAFIVHKISLSALGQNRLVFHLSCPDCGHAFWLDYYQSGAENERTPCPECRLKSELAEEAVKTAFDRQMRRLTGRLDPYGSHPQLDERLGLALANAVILLKPLLIVLLVGFYSEHIGHIIMFPAILQARLKRSINRRPLMFAFHSDASKVKNRCIIKQWSRDFIFTSAAKTAYDFLRTRPDQGNADNSLLKLPTDCWGRRRLEAEGEYYSWKTANMPLPKRTGNLVDLRDMYWTIEYEGALAEYGPPFIFTDEEHFLARRWLQDHGIKRDYVCFLSRDSLHHLREQPDKREMWAGIDYRNTDANSYIPAMNWLADQGVASLRTGSVAAEPLALRRDEVIDYAFLERGEFMEFMDIYLASFCLLQVSCGTGPDAAAFLMERPILFVNIPAFIGVGRAGSPPWLTCYVPKHMRYLEKGRNLSFREMLDHELADVYSWKHLKKAGVTLVDVTPDEMLLYVQEMYARITGQWVVTEEERQLQQSAQDIIHEYYPGMPLDYIYSYHYLKNNPFLLA